MAQCGASDSSPGLDASFTPDPYLYETAKIELTGNITINNPTRKHRGQTLRLVSNKMQAAGGP